MANVLKMTIVQSILSLHAQGWSHRRIAKALAINRRTFGWYVHQPQRPFKTSMHRLTRSGSADSNCPTRRSGPRGRQNPQDPTPVLTLRRRAVQPVAARRGRSSFWPSMARDYRPSGFIRTCAASRVRRGSATTAYGGSSSGWEHRGRYRSAAWSASQEQRLRSTSAPARRSSVPTASAAGPMSFGLCCHSRKAYSEACFRQTTEDFLRVLENAFWHFGGVPQTLVIDNLKAAVTHPDWFDPELNPKLQSFAGTTAR